MMPHYPLGSFPRFGHQERWAEERRARAIANSIIARRRKATSKLNVEIALFNWFLEVRQELLPKTAKGQKVVNGIDKKLLAISAKLENGQRVYFKCFANILRTIASSTKPGWLDILHLDDNTLAATVEQIGLEQLSQMRHPEWHSQP